MSAAIPLSAASSALHHAQTALLAVHGLAHGVPAPDLGPLITQFSPQASPVAGGGYCDLYLADMAGVGAVALKKMRVLGTKEKLKKKFRHETRIWSVLRHPYILPFLGTYELDGWTYMVSQWQPHGSLPAYLKAKPDADRLLALDQICDALLYLHSRKPAYVHGDIKGQNVLVSEAGDCLLCDFGLSVAVDEAEFISSVPTSIKGGGSLRYMAPELFEGGEKSTATDVFAFAMLILEVITGRIPFDTAKMEPAVITSILSGKRPTAATYPPCFDIDEADEQRVWMLMERCWKQLAGDRCTMEQAGREIKRMRGLEVPMEEDEAMKVEVDSARSLTPVPVTGGSDVQAIIPVVEVDVESIQQINVQTTQTQSLRSIPSPSLASSSSLNAASFGTPLWSAPVSPVSPIAPPTPAPAPILPVVAPAPQPQGNDGNLADALNEVADSVEQTDVAKRLLESYEGQRLQKAINKAAEDTRKELKRFARRIRF